MDRKLEEQLSAFLDGELSAEEELRVREAVAASPALRARLESLREVDRALAGLASREVPGDLRERLQARIHEEALRGRRSEGLAPRRLRRRVAAGALLAAAAAAILAVLVLPRLERRDGPGEPDSPVAQQEPAPDATPLAPVPEAPAVAPAPLPALAAREPEELQEDEPGLLEPLEDEGIEELELALASEAEPDAAIIEVLDWLEVMDELEKSGRG